MLKPYYFCIGIRRFLLLAAFTLFMGFWSMISSFLRKINIHFDQYLFRIWGTVCISIYGIKIKKIVHPKAKGINGIYTAPHSTFWDILVLGGSINGFFVSKADVAKWPIVGLGARFIRTVFIDREKGTSALRTMIRKGTELLKQNLSLLVFPEGTRTVTHMLPFKPGPFFVSFESGYPVIPVILKYYPEDLLVPKDKSNFVKDLWNQAHALRKGGIYLEVMEPINPKDFESPEALKDKTYEIMKQRYFSVNVETEF
jgi:1-acyl-sn-glycerol-3-phosphate acyltransferase